MFTACRRHLLASLVLLAATGGISCREPVGGKCSGKHECKEGLVCLDGRCFRLGGRGMKCEREEQCTSGLVCMEGKCFRLSKAGKACRTREECVSGLECLTGKCVELSKAGGACRTREACVSGLECLAGKCFDLENSGAIRTTADREVRNHVAEGNIAYRQLKFSDALSRYEEAVVEMNGGYAIAHSNRGLALHKLGRLEEAVAALRKAIELEGAEAAFHLNLGKVYATAGKYDLAVAEFDAALKLDPKMAAAVYNQAWVLDEKGDFGAAQEAVAKLAKMKGGPPGSVLLAGIVAAHQGQAEPLAAACLRPDDLPQQWHWLLDINQCLASGGGRDFPQGTRSELREAMKAFSTEQLQLARERLARVAAGMTDPKSVVPGWLLAMAWLAEGESGKAQEVLKEAEPLLSQISFSFEGESVEVSVDGRTVPPGSTSVEVLPGAHWVRVMKRSDEGIRVLAGALSVPPRGREQIAGKDHGFCPAACIPAGEFFMGCNHADGQGCGDDEKPGRMVYLDGFCIDWSEVTVAAYAACVKAGKCSRPGEGHACNWGKSDRSEHPINCVNWFQAKEYCEYAGKRLPTEAEWEKAARGTDGREYPWGNEAATCQYTVMADGVGGCGTDGTLPVCSKSPAGDSPCGLCDMAGNVWEWVSDRYGSDYYASSPERNPTGPGSGDSRVVRGGSWLLNAAYLRASIRYYNGPGNRRSGDGFRCASGASP